MNNDPCEVVEACRMTDVLIARAMGWHAIGSGIDGAMPYWTGIPPVESPVRPFNDGCAPIPGYTTDDSLESVREMIMWLVAQHLQWAIEQLTDGMIQCEALPTTDEHRTGVIARAETVGLAVGRVVLGIADVPEKHTGGREIK